MELKHWCAMEKVLAFEKIDMNSSKLVIQARDFCSRWKGRFFSSDAVSALRKTDILSHMVDRQKLPYEIYRSSFELLHEIGKVDIAAAVGLTMHQYALGTIATAEIFDEESRQKRDYFLKIIQDEKLLCAVSSFDMTIQSDGRIKAGLNAVMVDGRWVVTGRKRYQSMASIADILFFTAAISDHSFGLFYVVLKDNPNIAFDTTPPVAFLQETDTRAINFDQVSIAPYQLVSVADITATTQFHAYSLSWFQSLISAAYLGAARAALEVCIRKIATVGSGDSVLKHESAVGRMELQLRSALSLRYAVESVLVEASHTSPAVAMREFSVAAEVLKYTGTQVASSIVSQIRHLGGLSMMVDESSFGRISEYVLYGAMHPRSNSDLESSSGRSALSR